MSIRRPIAWSNDKSHAVGDMPARGKGGGSPVERGAQVPRESQRLREVLAAARLDLMSGWHSSALLRRGAAAEIAAVRPHLDLLKALDPTKA